jgi:hypothetical protein
MVGMKLITSSLSLTVVARHENQTFNYFSIVEDSHLSSFPITYCRKIVYGSLALA